MNGKGKFIPLLIFIFLVSTPFFLFYVNNFVFLVYLIILLTYWYYRTFVFSFFSLIGYFYFKHKRSKLKLIKNNPYQLVTLAVFNEELFVVKNSLNSILNQKYSKEKIIISISIEARRSTSSAKLLKTQLEKEFPNANLSVIIHPENLPGEVAGAASNKAYAQKNGYKFIQKLKLNLENIIVTIPDADAKFSEYYFRELAEKWTTHPKKNNVFFQTSTYKFDTTYFKSNIFTRILSSGLTISILSSSLLRPKARYTFSCFSLSLITLIACDYIDTSIPIDDTPFYMRALNKLNGDFECCLLHSEIYNVPVFGKNYLDSLNEQYQQYKRWGWGVIAFNQLLDTINNNNKIDFAKKIDLLITGIEAFFINKVLPLLVIISLYLFRNEIEEIPQNVLDFITALLIVSTCTLLPAIIIKLFVIPRPTNLKDFLLFLLKFVFEIPVSAVAILIFGFVPYVHASIELILSQDNYSKIKWSKKSQSQK